MTNSKDGAFKSWCETLKFIGFSYEAAQGKYPKLNKLFTYLFKIAKKEDLLPEVMRQFKDELDANTAEIKGILDNKLSIFMEIYAPYLEGFNEPECDDIRKSITTDIFVVDVTQGNTIVKKAAEEYRKNQIKTQMYAIWSDKAEGTKNPRNWSERFRTPILCCVGTEEYSEAKKAFSVLNSSVHSDTDIKNTIDFLNRATFFEVISDAEYRDTCFREKILGAYANMLKNLNAVKDTIEAMGIDTYDWSDSPAIKEKVRKMAEAEYNAGGSDAAISTIEKMSDAELKTWLKELVKKDLELGIKIITNGGK